MSEIKVNNIQSLSGTNGPVVSGITTMASSGAMSLPRGDTAYRGGRGRGIVAGGSPTINTIDYITISTEGDAKDFGDLATARYLHASCASSTRGLFAGGYTPYKQDIEYVTISSTGNGFLFGDLLSANRNFSGGGNETRGIFVGGLQPGTTYTKSCEYVTIASLGNSSSFGDLTEARLYTGVVNSSVRLVSMGGGVPSPVSRLNTIDYLTIATLGDATDFGDLLSPDDGGPAAACSSTRGLLMGGRNNTPSSATTHDTIQYITIASTGDAIDFGDLTRAQRFGTGTSNGTRAVQMGGANPGAQSNIDFVEIATLGNATSFGALSSTRHSAAAESDSHGGIG